jgi:hypothetical protein
MALSHPGHKCIMVLRQSFDICLVLSAHIFNRFRVRFVAAVGIAFILCGDFTHLFKMSRVQVIYLFDVLALSLCVERVQIVEIDSVVLFCLKRLLVFVLNRCSQRSYVCCQLVVQLLGGLSVGTQITCSLVELGMEI